MITTWVRRVLPVLALLAVAGCSFQGSVTDAGASASSHSGSSHTTATGPATGPTAGSTTGAGTGTGSSSVPAPGGGASSSTTAPPAGSPAGSGSNGSTSGPGRCHTSELTGSLVPGSPAAGQRYATLVLQNTGGRTCTVLGYGGIGLADGSGGALPTNQLRVSSPAAALVTLRPQASVRSALHWSAVAGPGDATTGDCQPVAAVLRVIPPDETDALSVAWNGGPVCSRGTIDQQAYAAG
jgi:uncharacterized protein DUF4232